jgi:hypothetical protein
MARLEKGAGFAVSAHEPPGPDESPTLPSESPSSDSDSRHGRFVPGTRLGKRYRIVSLLGSGGMGEVRIARQISHPNICRVYDVGEAEGHHFLAMARQICAGLGAAHERGWNTSRIVMFALVAIALFAYRAATATIGGAGSIEPHRGERK